MLLQHAVIVNAGISRLLLRVNQYRAYVFKSPSQIACIPARKKLYRRL